jgi:hypothetical protein
MVPDDVVDNAVLDPLFGTHYVVAVGVALDPLVILPCVGGEDLVQAALGHDELFGVDLHVGGLPGEPADARLVQEYSRVRERVPLALGARREASPGLVDGSMSMNVAIGKVTSSQWMLSAEQTGTVATMIGAELVRPIGWRLGS